MRRTQKTIVAVYIHLFLIVAAVVVADATSSSSSSSLDVSNRASIEAEIIQNRLDLTRLGVDLAQSKPSVSTIDDVDGAKLGSSRVFAQRVRGGAESRVDDDGSLGIVEPSTTSGAVKDEPIEEEYESIEIPIEHSERFIAWLAKHSGRESRYCGDQGAFPCEESLRREAIFQVNVAKVDAHNARVRNGGMKMRVGKFADLTEDEFAHRHVGFSRRKRQHAKGGGKVVEEVVEEEEDKEPALGEDNAKENIKGRSNSDPRTTQVRSRMVERGDHLVDAKSERRESVATRSETKAEARKPISAFDIPVDELPHELDERFVAFVKRYGKQLQYCPAGKYPCEEAFRRQVVFLSNLEDIEATNAMNRGGMKKRVTKFADLESDEFAREHATYANITSSTSNGDKTAAQTNPDDKMLHLLPTLGDLSAAEQNRKRELEAIAQRQPRMRSIVANSKTLPLGADGTFDYVSQGFPKSFDWRTKIDIGPVYSQGMCSGCWAFTTAQVIGDATAIATGKRNSVSPYHLLSCDNLDSECNTGNMATAYAWINVQEKGVLTAGDFPEGSECDVANSPETTGVKIDGYCEIAPLEGTSTMFNLMTALKQQTVAIGLNVKPLQLYGGGVVKLADCPTASDDPLLAINHAAVLVGWGYDEESKQPYWLMKNSYDEDWGEDGYAKLSMELGENGYGTCGLFTEQNYPLLNGKSCALGSSKKWSEKRGGDVYLEPDGVLVLPNGKGLISPFKFAIFGYDVTSILQILSTFCFSLCFVLVVLELYFCFFPELDGGHSDLDASADSPTGEPSVGSALLKKAEEGYGANEEKK